MELLRKLVIKWKIACKKKGYFSVYVGPEKQRFVVKVKLANHALFIMLLNDAAMEFGYQRTGPIQLPCDVHLFSSLLTQIQMKHFIFESAYI